jgi:alkylation response protein AidB-like acyl-CoA dehydrogenase
MSADDAEIRDELRAVARGLLSGSGRRGQSAGASRAASPGTSTDWQLLAGAGWLGLEVGAELDGGDATFAEVAVIVEELGRAAARSPYLGAIVLGVGTLNLLEPGRGRDDLLSQVASGAVVPAVALASGDGLTAPGQPPPFRIEPSARGRRLHGQAAFVPDATDATRLLLLAADPSGSPVIVDADTRLRGLRRTDQPVLDATRGFGLVTADAVEIGEKSVYRFAGDPAAAAGRLLDRAAVAVACDSLGLSEAMLDATVAYARVREQFGRPIGSFQAVKHACADMLVQVCLARQLVTEAVQRLAAPGADDAEVAVAASMAKSYACSAAVDVAGKAMQLHGGIGYTWESGIHVYLKRAAVNRALFGSPTAHRRRLAARYA